jgi:tRNA(Ile)-lysidine synthase
MGFTALLMQNYDGFHQEALHMAKHKSEKKVRNFINKYNMVVDHDKIIVGVSGGADSVCLLFVLKNLIKEKNFSFEVVHVNHGLRGEAANRDEKFVVDCCDKLGVLCHIYRPSIKEYAIAEKLSIEEAGRVLRRQIFEEAMKETKSNKVALAHHQRDNAETLLMNLVRGSGIRGVSGIKPVNEHYLRPLLCLTRDEIEGFLKEKGITFCTDETNENNDFTRNRIRNIILPNLEIVNPKAVIHMNETMNHLREIEEFVDEKVEEVYAKVVQVTESSGYSIKEECFNNEPVMIQKAVLKRAIENLSGKKKNISRIHIEQTLELFNKQVGKRVSLPYGLIGVREDARVLIVQSNSDGNYGSNSPLKEKREVAVETPGITEVVRHNIRIESRWIIGEEKDFYQPKPSDYTKAIDYDIIKDGLFLRTRESGDWITVDKKGSSQKLKSYFINEKIPRHMRDSIPILVDGKEVVWVVGYRMNMKYQINSDTKRILEIKVNHSSTIGNSIPSKEEL